MAETRSFIRNLEIQVGQLSKRIPEIPSNTLSSNTEVNPKEECKALTIEAKTEPKEKLATEELKEIRTQVETRSVPMNAPMKMEEPEEHPHPDVQGESKEEQLARFLHWQSSGSCKSISFTEALEMKPPYMAYLKNTISEKTALKGDEMVILTKECSALVQKKLPPKMPDPRSFFIPCAIGTITFEKALCDLGSSINLMPLSVMKKLGIQEVLPTRISLGMADISMKWADGVVEDILVKVEDLYLPANFVILDIGEDKDDSIILGRPFLATAKALIDVEKGELVLRLNEDHILFKIPNPYSSLDKGVESITEHPDIRPKFGIKQPSPSTEERGTKKKVPKGWRNKKIPTKDFSPSMRVVFTKSPVIPHTVSQILFLEHVELIHESIGRKFTIRDEDLIPYQPP
ncbi:uncharacterized protein LOC130957727 [Arachis stenosperma]|uniref:uncharacterized protein LOC130957727 n=1 Tax=Arachis stenosperma TaxID=217475 RepID=UPI0025ACB197|nr:uncharacterized protein LOC130957727 [Arachis stenosperma]